MAGDASDGDASEAGGLIPRIGPPLGVALAVGITILSRIDSALSDMRTPGDIGASVSTITSPAAIADGSAITSAVEVWRRWDATEPAVHTVGLLRAYALVDTLLVTVTLAALLLLALRGLRARNEAKLAAAGDDPTGWMLTDLSRLLDLARWPILAYGVADLTENLILPFVASAPTPLLRIASATKLLALAVAVLLLATAAAAVRPTGDEATQRVADLRPIRDALVGARVQAGVVLLVAALVFLPGDTGRQVDDLVLGVTARWQLAAAVTLAAGGLGLLLWWTGARCLAAYASGGPPYAGRPLRREPLVTAAVVGLATAVVAWALRGVQGIVALAVPGALVGLYGALSLPLREATRQLARQPAPRQQVVAWLCGGYALLVALLPLRTGVLLITAGLDRSDGFGLLLGGILGIAAALALVTRPDGTPTYLGPATGAIVTVAAALALWAAVRPIRAGQALGALTVLLIFLTLVTALLSALVLLSNRLGARGILAVLGYQRVPLVTLLLACLVGSSVLQQTWGYHDVRVLADDAPPAALTLDEALDAWETGAAEGDAGRPLVFVAAAGGGIRAAYWTSAVLSCLATGTTHARYGDEQPACGAVSDAAVTRPDALVMASGISGGSLGLAVTRALGDDPAAYDATLRTDYLGPVMAGYTFRDAPNGLLRLRAFGDRAAVLEDAWADSVPDDALRCGFLRAARADGCSAQDADAASPPDGSALAFPLLLLNGASVSDGCRVTVSTLDLAPATRPDGTATGDCYDLAPAVRSPLRDGEAATTDATPRILPGTADALDSLCVNGAGGHDLSLATAAHVSARFPWVSPTGRLVSCADPEHSRYVVDGGVIESSGASPLVELWPRVAQKVAQWNATATARTCVVPRLVLIDNGYADVTPAQATSQRPLESIAPVDAAASAYARTTPVARQALADAFAQAFGDITCAGVAAGDSVAYFFPLKHPGPEAPLGWTLSQYARRDLHEQLFDPARNRHNCLQVELVRRWFGGDPGPSCTSTEAAQQ